MEIPAFRASNTVNSRWSSCWASRSIKGALLRGAAFRVSREISAPRTAFIRAISKVAAMAMTSPVAFIWVPSFRLEPANLSKGHLGTFTTT